MLGNGSTLPRCTSVNWPIGKPSKQVNVDFQDWEAAGKPRRLASCSPASDQRLCTVTPSYASGYPGTVAIMAPHLGAEEYIVGPSFHNALDGVTKASLVSKHPSASFLQTYYEIVHEIGKGTFGHVHLIRERQTGGERVCKDVSFREGSSDKPQLVLELTKLEIQLLAELDHPSIVRMYEYSEDLQQSRCVFIMEYVDGGDCHALLGRSPQGLQEPLVGQLIHQILVAVAYCHRCQVLHRDIKPENILMTSPGRGGAVACKLMDFGLASRQDTSWEYVGTPSYFAPEIVTEKRYTAKSDVWAIGVTAIEMLTGQLPFGRFKEHRGDIKHLFGTINKYRTPADFESRLSHLLGWQQRSAEATKFFTRLLARDVVQRPYANQAANHPWCDKHKAAPAGLTRQILQSLANYAGAPPPVRCCLLAIAVRANRPDQDRIGSAFLSADVDGDGKISHEDLNTAVERARYWWDPDINATTLVHIANLDHTGGLSFSEFVAACMYDEEGSLEQIADDAFTVLDDDRDGNVCVEDIRKLFPELDTYVLKRLPQNRPFTREEWCRCFEASCAVLGGTEPRHVDGLTCGSDLMQCNQSGAARPCQDLTREPSSDSDQQGVPSLRSSRRAKKGTIDCWGFPCAADSD